MSNLTNCFEINRANILGEHKFLRSFLQNLSRPTTRPVPLRPNKHVPITDEKNLMQVEW